MQQIGAGCWNCGGCGCETPGCPEGAVSDDAEAPCSAEALALCQANTVEGGICSADSGNCQSFGDVPCAGGWGVADFLGAFAAQGQLPADFASTEKVCESPAALACVDPEGACATCNTCGVNATGNFECPDSCNPTNCQQCVPMIGCLNCANPDDASRTV